ncbi:MAG: hypothetical protein NTW66_00680 [Candidatus Magasanikbacteria bacterium]|nr:hypothetical protein [Candidatus Magasanikbacteria bacterium]
MSLLKRMEKILPNNYNLFIVAFIVVSIVLFTPIIKPISIAFGYGGGGGGGGGTTYSSTKVITAFVISGQVGVTTIIESSKSIVLTMPYGTSVTALVPTIIMSGVSVNPASGAANNFSSPQTYTVTAADGSTQNYIVTVNVALATQTDWYVNTIKRTDIVRDGKIDILDFNALMVNWGKNIIGNSADTNQDGLVDILDFNLLMVNWGKTEK